MKHCLECLIYCLNQNKNQGVNREVKSSKSILSSTTYTNVLHSCDFLYFNLMNYYLVWEIQFKHTLHVETWVAITCLHVVRFLHVHCVLYIYTYTYKKPNMWSPVRVDNGPSVYSPNNTHEKNYLILIGWEQCSFKCNTSANYAS